MTLKDAISKCHVRSSIYRKSNPKKKYAKNHPVPFCDRIPILDQVEDDWEEWDPREEDDCSLSMFND
jgi:hypothetical protein